MTTSSVEKVFFDPSLGQEQKKWRLKFLSSLPHIMHDLRQDRACIDDTKGPSVDSYRGQPLLMSRVHSGSFRLNSVGRPFLWLYMNSETPQPGTPFTSKVHMRSTIRASHSQPMWNTGDSITFTWTAHVSLAVDRIKRIIFTGGKKNSFLPRTGFESEVIIGRRGALFADVPQVQINLLDGKQLAIRRIDVAQFQSTVKVQFWIGK